MLQASPSEPIMSHLSLPLSSSLSLMQSYLNCHQTQTKNIILCLKLDGEGGEHKDFLCSLSQHKIKPVSLDVESAGNFFSLVRFEGLTNEHECLEEKGGGSLLTLRSGCCTDRHRRDIARCCRLSHKPVKRRRETRSRGPSSSGQIRDRRWDTDRPPVCRMRADRSGQKCGSAQRTRSRRTISRLAGKWPLQSRRALSLPL